MSDIFSVAVTFSAPEIAVLADIAEARGQRVAEFVHDFAVTAGQPLHTSVRAREVSPPVLDRAGQMKHIMELTDLGWSKSEIAARLHMHRDTVTTRLRQAYNETRRSRA